MPAPTILFDLDGTLVDTAPDLVETLNTILGREGLPPVPFAAARNMIGGGAKRMLESGLASNGRSPTDAELNRLFSDFLDHYEHHIADLSRPFPHLESALDRLARQGCRLAVCTNKLERLSVKLLDALGLAHWFAAICGQDTFGIQKPNPEMLRQTIARVSGASANAVMVGDSNIDIDAARAANIPVVAVDFGYTAVPVIELGPDRVISSFAELVDAVSELGPLLPGERATR